MDRIEEVKKILRQARYGAAPYKMGSNPGSWHLGETAITDYAYQICQLFETEPKPTENTLIIKETEHPEERIPVYQPKSSDDRLLDIDEYLAEMGWTISKDGMQYAWLKQFHNRQDAKTASIKDAEIAELRAINEKHRILNGELRVEIKNKDTEWRQMIEDNAYIIGAWESLEGVRTDEVCLAINKEKWEAL